MCISWVPHSGAKTMNHVCFGRSSNTWHAWLLLTVLVSKSALTGIFDLPLIWSFYFPFADAMHEFTRTITLLQGSQYMLDLHLSVKYLRLSFKNTSYPWIYYSILLVLVPIGQVFEAWNLQFLNVNGRCLLCLLFGAVPKHYLTPTTRPFLAPIICLPSPNTSSLALPCHFTCIWSLSNSY
jgi:hypothetical protein